MRILFRQTATAPGRTVVVVASEPNVANGDDGESDVVERSGEAAITAGVIRGTVGDDDDAGGMLKGPPTTEELRAVGIEHESLFHQGLLSLLGSRLLGVRSTTFQKGLI
jgi:hypothetical protein